MIFALLFLLFLIIGAVIYLINRKFRFLDSWGGFILGLGFAIVMAVAFVFILLMMGGIIKNDIMMYASFAIGASQLLYIIPLILLLIRNKQYDMMKGVIAGALVIALLNGGCFVLFSNVRIGG